VWGVGCRVVCMSDRNRTAKADVNHDQERNTHAGCVVV
jgi:hypothetical protein